jgi:hypothetical protein
MMKDNMRIILCFLLAAASFWRPALGQVSFQIPVTLTNGADTTRLRIGVNPGNSVAMDTAQTLGWFREVPLPPMPPQPFRWAARLVTVPGRDSTFPLGMMGGAEMDFRAYTGPTQVDTFAIHIDGDNANNYPTLVSWPSGLSAHGTSWTIKPQSGKGWPATDMIAVSSVTIPPGGPIHILIIKEGATGTNDVGRLSNAAYTFQLSQNYPNPFNPRTVVGWQLAAAGSVKLRVYDLLGREVATLIDGVMPAGEHTVTFDATRIASGMYIYRLQAGAQTAVKKMMVIK